MEKTMNDAVVLNIKADQQELKLQNPRMKLAKKSGEHSRMELKGVVLPDCQADVQRIVPGSDLQVFCMGQEKIIFRGIVVYVDISMETGTSDPLNEIHIKAMSYSCQLDRERKNRAFQNTGELYQNVCNLLLKDYPDAGVIMGPETDGKALGTLAVQYYETDWEFLSRLAARLNQPLFVDSSLKGPKLFFGTVWGGTCHNITGPEESEVEEIHILGRKDCPGLDAFCWETSRADQKALETGDMIRYKQVVFYIREAEISVENHTVLHRYTFCGKDGFLYLPIKIRISSDCLFQEPSKKSLETECR